MIKYDEKTIFSKKFDRRNFIKTCSFATAGILLGCGSTPSKKVTDTNIQWDANPVIPVPDGCYVGWHYENRTRDFMNEGGGVEKKLLDHHEKTYGKSVAVHSFADRRVNGSRFPTAICSAMAEEGVFPIIRYHPYAPDFEIFSSGERYEEFKRFVKSAAEYKKPFFFVPFPEANIGGLSKHVHSWAGGSGKKLKKAWGEMYNIMEGEGANENAVWGLHLLSGKRNPGRFSSFAVDPELLDWVGFTCYNIERQIGRTRSLSTTIAPGYLWAKRNYPNKPMALFELGTSSTSRQGRWIKDAYKSIKRRDRIKLAVYAEYYFHNSRAKQTDSTFISKAAAPAYKEAISDPHFIGSSKI